MSRFCGTCGSPLRGGKDFCGSLEATGASSRRPSSTPAQPAFTPLSQWQRRTMTTLSFFRLPVFWSLRV